MFHAAFSLALRGNFFGRTAPLMDAVHPEQLYGFLSGDAEIVNFCERLVQGFYEEKE
jgi:hypothetical protein